MIKYTLILYFFFYNVYSFGQTLKGKITDSENNHLPGANIVIKKTNIGTHSDTEGFYSIELQANRSYEIEVSFIGYMKESIRLPMMKKGQIFKLDVQLNPKNNIDDIIVTDKASRKKSLTRIKTKHVDLLPTSAGGVEAILKTLPGVSSANELSSQYSVRGGNFDENLVYVNNIEIYRPFLIHAGEQEGLSFVNTDMVESIYFSAGGFSSKYGDKMSSVLDIKYKTPTSNKASIQTSLLGTNMHIEGVNKNKSLSYLIGARYKTNQYVLNSLDTKAEYNPTFSDIQTFLQYSIQDNWTISFLGNISRNIYNMKPKDRDTEFGNINEALKLRVYFEGQESDQYQTYFGALSTTYSPNLKTKLTFTSSAFRTLESESFDILGEYWLYELDNNLGSDNFGDIKFDRGVGKFIEHARNELEANVINIQHNGRYIANNTNKINWGIKIQKEDIQDKIKEWTLIDSAGFTLPHPFDNIGNNSNPDQEILMSEYINSNISLSSYRESGHIEFSKDITNFTLNSGVRMSYWTFNKELLISPRINLSYIPFWKKDIVFRSAAGIYYQSPFYREIRDKNGIVNPEIESQKSTHFVLGSDYLFYAWGRPFKLVSELYYKKLENLIPYKIDNVRIQYLPNNNSNGYATGVDLKINGEFVSGVESWASLSIMKTEEDIENDSYINDQGETIYPGFIPRPTDQRVNFSMFFQDYIPKFPDYKVHLNMIYGTGLSFGPPNSEKYEDILRIPDYRRVDIGFSAVIKKESEEARYKWMKKINSMWISAEIFNLLDIDNTVSYLWVSDINGRQYAVPNYLTSRQINVKLIIKI